MQAKVSKPELVTKCLGVDAVLTRQQEQRSSGTVPDSITTECGAAVRERSPLPQSQRQRRPASPSRVGLPNLELFQVPSPGKFTWW